MGISPPRGCICSSGTSTTIGRVKWPTILWTWASIHWCLFLLRDGRDVWGLLELVPVHTQCLVVPEWSDYFLSTSTHISWRIVVRMIITVCIFCQTAKFIAAGAPAFPVFKEFWSGNGPLWWSRIVLASLMETSWPTSRCCRQVWVYSNSCFDSSLPYSNLSSLSVVTECCPVASVTSGSHSFYYVKVSQFSDCSCHYTV